MADDSGNVSRPDSYVIDLQVWGISNDFTNPLATSNGINNALQWAVNNGYTEVTLPKGDYLIEHTTPIIPPSYVTFNLNGSTLKMETNGQLNYNIVLLSNNQQYVTIKNGKLQGDRYTHDYTTISGTHESGECINVSGACSFIHLEDLELYESTGDSVCIGATSLYIASILNTQVVLGGIDKVTGLPTTSTNTIRSTKTINFSNNCFKMMNKFQLTGGPKLSQGQTTNFFCAYFYKADGTYLSYIDRLRFVEDIEVPTGADHVVFVFYQSTIPSNFQTAFLCSKSPDHIYVMNCNLHHSRRCGLAMGGHNIYIVGNKIHHIGGTAPQTGIDMEEGRGANQNIYIENNDFYSNAKYNICIIGTRHVKVIGNKFNATALVGLVVTVDAEDIMISNNLFDRDYISLGGTVIFSNNLVSNSIFSVPAIDGNVHISDSIFTNSNIHLNGARAYGVTVDNCKFYNDVDKLALGTYLSTLTLGLKPAIIRNCVIDGLDINYVCSITLAKLEDGWIIDNTVFTNIKTIIAFPNGKFTNCRFLTDGYMGFTGSGNYVFENCYFNQSGNGVVINGMAAIKISNCFFYVTGAIGYGNSTISIRNVGRMIFDGNTIDAQALIATNFSLIETQATFAGTLLLITNNNILTNKACRAIDTSAAVAVNPIVVKNNNLVGGCTLHLRNGDISLRND